ncbi:hypothetical protein ACA910_007581 [Epithemia clementina (nom. ined.)]
MKTTSPSSAVSHFFLLLLLLLVVSIPESTCFSLSSTTSYQQSPSLVTRSTIRGSFSISKSRRRKRVWPLEHTTTALSLGRNNNNSNDQDNDENEKRNALLNQPTFGGYTVKQRLRDEVESPFRTVRLYFFGASLASAVIAFYFSMLTLFKALDGGFADVPSVTEAWQSVGINVGAVVVCAAVTYRDYQAQQVNLKRIKQGGALASLVVERPVVLDNDNDNDKMIPASVQPGRRATLADYRRLYRVLIAAGGPEYIQTLCRSLNADQLSDENTLPQAIENADLLVVPVLLQSSSSLPFPKVGDTQQCWTETTPTTANDRNFDLTRANRVLAFPRGPAAWAEVLAPEVATATQQGFDVSQKGITLVLKKNGKILRRATGQPQWAGLLGFMQVFDKNFGMPGDDQVYPIPNTKSSSSSSSTTTTATTNKK